MKKHISTRDITKIAIMAALVFVATFLIKIPSFIEVKLYEWGDFSYIKYIKNAK